MQGRERQQRGHLLDGFLQPLSTAEQPGALRDWEKLVVRSYMRSWFCFTNLMFYSKDSYTWETVVPGGPYPYPFVNLGSNSLSPSKRFSIPRPAST